MTSFRVDIPSFRRRPRNTLAPVVYRTENPGVGVPWLGFSVREQGFDSPRGYSAMGGTGNRGGSALAVV